MFEDENEKQVRTSTGWLLKNKEMPKDENVKRVRNYANVVSTKKLSNEREK